MSKLNFDTLKATTMTVIVPLEGKINIEAAFPLLKVTRLDLPPPKRFTKKFKLPFINLPGAILSASYLNMKRGIIKSKSDKFFRNSITVDVCTSRKNVNCKVSTNTIQECGPDSEELALEAADHIIKHLYDIQDELEYMHEHYVEAIQLTEWIKDVSKGDDYIVDSVSHEIIEFKEGDHICKDHGILLDASNNPYIIDDPVQKQRNNGRKGKKETIRLPSSLDTSYQCKLKV